MPPTDQAPLPLVFHRRYDTELPPAHAFPMSKFPLLHEHLIRTGLADACQFHAPDDPPLDWIELVHDPDYVAAYLGGTISPDAMRRIGFPWSEAGARRTRIAVGGTLLTARLALEHGLACNTAGGTHHAFPDYGSGFCIFNDIAVALRALRREGAIRRALVVDLDVHQGDGTAMIFAADRSVFTFSMHGAKNFPRIKRRSDLDVALPDGTGDARYLETLHEHLPRLLDAVQPDLVVYDAGVDPHERDRYGRLALTDAGLAARDRTVIEACRDAGHPLACVIGGGYDRDLEALVQRHALLHRAADARWRADAAVPRPAAAG